MNKQKWIEVGRWNIGRSDGTSEEYILQRDKDTGDFKIKNDFGNVEIEMELMSGMDFVRSVLEKMNKAIEDDIFNLLDEETEEENHKQIQLPF